MDKESETWAFSRRVWRARLTVSPSCVRFTLDLKSLNGMKEEGRIARFCLQVVEK